MQHPFEKLSPRLLAVVYWLAFAANFAFIFVFAGGGHPHTEEAQAAGIRYSTLDVELAQSPEQVAAIREALGETGRASMTRGAITQLVWPFFYANAIAAGIVLLLRGASLRGAALALGRAMAWGAWLAGVCDLMENLTIVLMLGGVYATPIPEIKFVVTLAKFGMLVAALLYLLGLVGWVYQPGVLKHPLTRLNDLRFKRLYTALFVAVLLLSGALTALGKGFADKKDADGKSYDIVAFEFAQTPAQAQHIVDTWGAEGVAAAQKNTMLDYLYLLVYSTLIGMGVLALASAGHFSGIWAVLALLLAWAQWLAGLLDAVENTALMLILGGNAASPWPELAYYCAFVKFAIIGAGLVFILGLLPVAVRAESSHKTTPAAG